MKENIELKENFKQVCVWPSTIVGAERITEFEQYMLLEFNTRVQYLEEIQTKPDMKNGFPIHNTGDRNDLFFGVYQEDVSKFAIPRLQAGIRWVEDAIGEWNNEDDYILYPERVRKYGCW